MQFITDITERGKQHEKAQTARILFGMVITALVMGLAVPALAAVANKTLEAHYMDIKLVVDGVPITPGTQAATWSNPLP